MEFKLDTKRRKRLSFKMVGASIGGKIALTFFTLCIILAFVVPWYLINFTSALDADRTLFKAVFSAVLFWFAGCFGLVFTYKQRSLHVTMRTNERLFLKDGWLRYSFHTTNNMHIRSLNDIAINLRQTSVARGAAGECKFVDGVFWHYYKDPSIEPLCTPEEMEPIGKDFGSLKDGFIIGDYWQPSLYDTLLEEQKRLAQLPDSVATQASGDAETQGADGTGTQAPDKLLATLCVNTFVDIEQNPNKGKAALFYVLAAFVALVALLNMLVFRRIGVIFVFSFAVWIFNQGKHAAATTEARHIVATLSFDGKTLVVDLPGCRLFDEERVDQRWICDRSQIERLLLDSMGSFHIFSRNALDVAMYEGRVLATENRMQIDIDLRLDANDQERLSKFFSEGGFEVERRFSAE